MSISTTSSDPLGPGQSADVFGQVARLSRDKKEHLLVLIQEDLDGGPFIGDLPELPADDAATVSRAWRQTINRRIEDMRSGKVEEIDALGSAERLLLKMLRKYGP
jgi:hypothetical protein